jgi:hypothetical protein
MFKLIAGDRHDLSEINRNQIHGLVDPCECADDRAEGSGLLAINRCSKSDPITLPKLPFWSLREGSLEAYALESHDSTVLARWAFVKG